MEATGELVVRTAHDEVSAVWTAHYAPLAGWIASLVGDTETARDMAAEAFTRLLGRWRRVDDPRGFLYVVATNLVRDHWRREERRRRATGRLHRERHPDAQPAADPWLRDLVERLPDRFRDIVLLHYYADLPVAAVASAVGRPEGTVKRELSEARALLLAAIEATP